MANYAYIPEMHQLEKVHAKLHTLAKYLVAIYKEGKIEEARRRLDEIEPIAGQLTVLLNNIEAQVQVHLPKEPFNKPDTNDAEIYIQELAELQRLNLDLDKRIRQQSRELYEAKERFELVAKATRDAVWDWDLITNKIWWNEGFKSLFGYKESEIEPGIESWYGRVHPEERERVIAGIHKAIDNGGRQWSDQYRFRKADGSYAVVLDRGYALHNEEGNPTRMVGSMTDITGQKENENKLRSTAERLQLALDAGKLGSYELSLHTGEMNSTAQCKKNFGLPENDFLNYEKLISLVVPEDRDGMQQALNEAIAKQMGYNTEYRVQWPDRSLRWIRVSGIGVYNDAHELLKMVCVTLDITEEKAFSEELTKQVKDRTTALEKSKQEIENSEARLAAVFNNAQSGMFTFMPVRNGKDEIIDFRFVITNPTFATYVGQTPEILNGALGSTWFPGYLHNGVFDMYKQTYNTGETLRKDIHYNVDQHNIYLDLMSSKVGDEVLVTFTDYTLLKQAELQLQKYVEELERSNTNLEEFAHAASHDLKEPIRKILFFTDQLKMQLANRLVEQEMRTFTRIERAGQRMRALVDDLLLYSHVNHRSHQMEEVDLTETVEKVLEDLELEVQQKNAVINIGTLPKVQGYKRQLQQLFQNLISNALKYNKPGIAPVIDIRSFDIIGIDEGLISSIDSGKAFHLIEVSDNGIGFQKSESEKIFHMFQRLHGDSEYKGTGIGLSIVRKVVENHNGKIGAEAEPGKGATFKIYLPAL